MVLINRQLDPPIFHQVAADYMAGVAMVAKALADRRHHRVAYISANQTIVNFVQRLDTYRGCVLDTGSTRTRSLFESGELTCAGGYAACKRLWTANRRKPPTAIVAASDTMAVGILRFLDESGIDVPGQVSITSFDGTWFADFTHRSLTTVVTPMYEIGRQAFTTLLEAMKGEIREPRSVVLPVQLRLRESIGLAVR